ncbi:hypothetical protein Tco_0152160 [Tanacetum coccineum]
MTVSTAFTGRALTRAHSSTPANGAVITRLSDVSLALSRCAVYQLAYSVTIEARNSRDPVPYNAVCKSRDVSLDNETETVGSYRVVMKLLREINVKSIQNNLTVIAILLSPRLSLLIGCVDSRAHHMGATEVIERVSSPFWMRYDRVARSKYVVVHQVSCGAVKRAEVVQRCGGEVYDKEKTSYVRQTYGSAERGVCCASSLAFTVPLRYSPHAKLLKNLGDTCRRNMQRVIGIRDIGIGFVPV